MKNSKIKTLLTLSILLLFIIFLNSCESQVSFAQINPPEKMGVSKIESVKSYTLRYNPKAYATITITLANGAKYEATDLSASQTTALLSILNEHSIKFDTENDEFVIK